MASGKGDYLIQKELDYALRGTAFTPASPLYVALYTTTQDAADGGTECVDANYVRQAVSFNAESGGSCTNNGAITWPALAGGVTIVAVAIKDAATTGNLYYWVNLGSSVVFTAGQQPRITNTSMVVTET